MTIDTNQYASLEELLTAYETATDTEREAFRQQGDPEPEFDFFKLFDFEQEDLYKRVMQKMDSLMGLGKRSNQVTKREETKQNAKEAKIQQKLAALEDIF